MVSESFLNCDPQCSKVQSSTDKFVCKQATKRNNFGLLLYVSIQ